MVIPRSTAATPSRSKSLTWSRAVRAGSAEAAAITPTGPGPISGNAAAIIAGSAPSGVEPSSTMRASRFAGIPKLRARPAEPLGDAGGAELLGGHRDPKVDAGHPEPARRRRDQRSGVAAQPGQLDRHVDARAGVEGAGLVGPVDPGVAEHQPRHQIVERVGAEGVAARADRRAIGDLAPAHLALERAGRGLERAQIEAVAVVEIAEADVAERAGLRVDRGGAEVDEHDPVFAADPARVALDDERGVLVDAEAAAHAGGVHRHDEPPEPAALDEMLVDHAVGKEAEALAHQQAGLLRDLR